jgi:hypothetical protein
VPISIVCCEYVRNTIQLPTYLSVWEGHKYPNFFLNFLILSKYSRNPRAKPRTLPNLQNLSNFQNPPRNLRETESCAPSRISRIFELSRIRPEFPESLPNLPNPRTCPEPVLNNGSRSDHSTDTLHSEGWKVTVATRCWKEWSKSYPNQPIPSQVT